MINIASLDNKIRSRSINQIKKSILFCKKSKAKLYTFHPGFLSDPEGEGNGNKKSRNYDFKWKAKLLKKNYLVSWSYMIKSIKEIVEFAKKKNINIAIETEGSVNASDHLLMQKPIEYKKFMKIFSNKECEFSYRNSIFKKEEEKKFIITKVEFKLNKKHLNKTTYGAIEEELKKMKQETNPETIAEAVIKIRNRKLPDPKLLGNSGSFFKNPIIETSKFNALKKEYPEMAGYTISNSQTKVAAGWLIDNAGLKGYRKADAGVHKNQALVLVNYGNASGTEIINLAKKIQQKIKAQYGIIIEPEVSIL